MPFLLFDLDGTLIDSTKDIADSVRHIQKKFGFLISEDAQVAEFIGDGVGPLVARALPGIDTKKLSEAVEDLKQYYREHCLAHTAPYPGVSETLMMLRGQAMAVVTNKPERISKRIIDGLKWADYFPVIIGGDTLPEKKPSPAPVQKAITRLKNIFPEANGKSAIMIGDSSHDVLAGKAAGIKTIGVLSNIGNHAELRASQPDHLIETFLELKKLLAK